MSETGTKAFAVTRLKAGPDDGLEEGEALAMISLYGLKDADKDRTAEGGFDQWAADVNGGGTVPMVWQHGRGLFDYVGDVVSADPEAEDAQGRKGLQVKVKFDINSDIPKARDAARQAYKNVKGRRVQQWSYAWEGDTKKLDDGTRELSNLRLSEVSPVLRGALAETHTVAVKQEPPEPPEGSADDTNEDLAAFQQTWDGLGGMIATDADLVEWLGDANGPDCAGIVQAIASYIANDMWQESQPGSDEDAGDVAYFAKGGEKVTQAQRDAWAKSGVAMPDGSWPIPNADYLDKAVRAYGRTGSQGHPNTLVKRWIIKRARALNLVSHLPDSWNVSKSRDPRIAYAETVFALPEVLAS